MEWIGMRSERGETIAATGGRRAGGWMLLLVAFAATGCGTSTPYFLVESRLVESSRATTAPDVTETPAFRSVRAKTNKVGLRPPDVCADQGLSAGGGRAQLQLGVLRTRCGVEMAEFERALARSNADRSLDEERGKSALTKRRRKELSLFLSRTFSFQNLLTLLCNEILILVASIKCLEESNGASFKNRKKTEEKGGACSPK